MHKELYLVRHGNTFDAHQIPLRVGCRTDLPLALSGQKQLTTLGKYIANQQILIEALYASELLRAQQSAQIITQLYSNQPLKIIIEPLLNEVDYGVDDGQAETAVIKRIGQNALNAWETQNIIPNGWNIQPDLLVANWQQFVSNFLTSKQQSIMLVTSNGIARFLAPAIGLATLPKLATGSISKLTWKQQTWMPELWNYRP
jgi:broad specificity phosphatase PhoE